MKLVAVPGHFVLALCIASFLFGRLTQQGAQLPDPTPVQLQSSSQRKLGAVTAPEDVIVAEHEAKAIDEAPVVATAAPTPAPKVCSCLARWTPPHEGLGVMHACTSEPDPWPSLMKRVWGCFCTTQCNAVALSASVMQQLLECASWHAVLRVLRVAHELRDTTTHVRGQSA